MIDALKAEIEAKFGSIYKFCKANPQVKKATAYLVLNGKYPGKIYKQAQVLQNILHGISVSEAQNKQVQEYEILDVLQKHKCLNCRLLKKNCSDCKQKTAQEAQAVYQFLLARQ